MRILWISLGMLSVAALGCQETKTTTSPPNPAATPVSSVPAAEAASASAPPTPEASAGAQPDPALPTDDDLAKRPADADGSGRGDEDSDADSVLGGAATGDPEGAGDDPDAKEGADRQDPGDAPEGVTVENVGMRIAGGGKEGKGDAATKTALREAITKHHKALAACFRYAPPKSKKRKQSTFGADLRIGKAGGNPKVRQMRSGIKGEDFLGCMKTALERIEFPAPKDGKAIMVSYSMRFLTAKKP